MNLLPAYEQMIAEKVEGVEIPDMADAIWVRIEAGLDVEMPVNDIPATLPGKPFLKNPAVWIISAGIMAILVFFILSRNPRTAPSPQRVLPKHTEPTMQPDTIMKQHFKASDTLKLIPDKNAGTIGRKHVADTAVHRSFVNEETGSLLKIPPAVIAKPVIITPPAIKIPPGMMPPSIDTNQRKKYGVVVSDSDYKFKIKPKQ